MADLEDHEHDIRGNTINVSGSKAPSLYVNLSKKFLQSNDEVELHALGNAIAVCVITSEILTRTEFATVKKINTSTEELTPTAGGRSFNKPKITIILAKSDRFDELMAQTWKTNEEDYENDDQLDDDTL
eukprot:GFYU01005506.1.p1 GENE.GFYU01005506.1~~GFYU01005506.1.p1  ORF type:complete len:148 (-),score=35.00 GFYU01005506.1:86-472(-)